MIDKKSKISVLVLGLGSATVKFIKSNISNKYIRIVGLIPDESVPISDREEILAELRGVIPILEFSHENMARADVIFTPEYRRIIPDEYCNKYLIVNCHGGLLPKWRGFAANAWAIMNGVNEIGYSIHRVVTVLDGGKIYFVKQIPISEDETYSDVHDEMLDSIANDVPKVLYEIVSGDNKGLEQSAIEGVAYCTKFKRSMGDISSFTNSSQYYVNLYRCMAKPLGTGLYFVHKGKNYYVGKLEHGKKYGAANYIGEVGKIVNICNDRLWVKTADNVVVLSNITCDETKVLLDRDFRNGMEI